MDVEPSCVGRLLHRRVGEHGDSHDAVVTEDGGHLLRHQRLVCVRDLLESAHGLVKVDCALGPRLKRCAVLGSHSAARHMRPPLVRDVHQLDTTGLGIVVRLLDDAPRAACLALLPGVLRNHVAESRAHSRLVLEALVDHGQECPHVRLVVLVRGPRLGGGTPKAPALVEVFDRYSCGPKVHLETQTVLGEVLVRHHSAHPSRTDLWHVRALDGPPGQRLRARRGRHWRHCRRRRRRGRRGHRCARHTPRFLGRRCRRHWRRHLSNQVPDSVLQSRSSRPALPAPLPDPQAPLPDSVLSSRFSRPALLAPPGLADPLVSQATLDHVKALSDLGP